MGKEIFIIRHGETDYNRDGIIQGRGVDPSLNERGRDQALAFFNHYKDIPLDMIYFSSLKRTRETVQPFIDKGYPWQEFSELDEIDWGIFEGKRSTSERQVIYRSINKAWNQGELHKKIQKGESPIDLQKRQNRFITHLLSQDEQNVLICTHGRAMRSMLCIALGMDLRKMNRFPHKNLSLYKLNYSDDKFTLVLSNDLTHLDG